MNQQEQLNNIKQRVDVALKLGILDEKSRGLYESTLIQIMNDAERQRIRCNQLASDFKTKAAQAEAQANAYSQMSSVVWAVLNGFVNAAEQNNEEIKELKEEKSKKKSKKNKRSTK